MKNKISCLLILVAIVFFSSCNNGTSEEKQKPEKKETTSVNSQTTLDENVLTGNEKIVLLSTDLGDIKIALYDGTPKHRDNFIKLTSKKYFDGLLFHRVIKNFMIQGGDPNSKNAKPGIMLGDGGPGYKVAAEFLPEKYFHKKGAIAAAREGDNINPEKASAGSQFYIVQGKTWDDASLDKIEKSNNIKYSEKQRYLYKTLGGTPFLDGNYTVFGEVVDGIEVVDKIADVRIDKNNRPLNDVKMNIKILK